MWTNLNGFSIPSQFRLTVYAPLAPRQGVADFTEMFRIEGILRSIEQLRTFTFEPSISTRTLVKDARYASYTKTGEPLGYVTVSGWLTEAQAAEYVRNPPPASRGRVARGERRIWVLLVLAGMAAIPLVTLSAKLRNNKKGAVTK